MQMGVSEDEQSVRSIYVKVLCAGSWVGLSSFRIAIFSLLMLSHKIWPRGLYDIDPQRRPHVLKSPIIRIGGGKDYNKFETSSALVDQFGGINMKAFPYMDNCIGVRIITALNSMLLLWVNGR